MSHSNERLRELAQATEVSRDPGFAVVVSFDYYDGPERGVALYPSGEGVRFSALGDSKSRLFRAFELIPIEGQWSGEVRARSDVSNGPHPLILVPKASEALARLEREVFEAPATCCYIAVGSPDFKHLHVSVISEEELNHLRQLSPPGNFEAVHQIIKRVRSRA